MLHLHSYSEEKYICSILNRFNKFTYTIIHLQYFNIQTQYFIVILVDN